jgi:hypothetical protein
MRAVFVTVQFGEHIRYNALALSNKRCCEVLYDLWDEEHPDDPVERG